MYLSQFQSVYAERISALQLSLSHNPAHYSQGAYCRGVKDSTKTLVRGYMLNRSPFSQVFSTGCPQVLHVCPGQIVRCNEEGSSHMQSPYSFPLASKQHPLWSTWALAGGCSHSSSMG